MIHHLLFSAHCSLIHGIKCNIKKNKEKRAVSIHVKYFLINACVLSDGQKALTLYIDATQSPLMMIEHEHERHAQFLHFHFEQQLVNWNNHQLEAIFIVFYSSAFDDWKKSELKWWRRGEQKREWREWRRNKTIISVMTCVINLSLPLLNEYYGCASLNTPYEGARRACTHANPITIIWNNHIASACRASSTRRIGNNNNNTPCQTISQNEYTF